MPVDTFSRRSFLQGSSAIAVLTLAEAACSARDESADFDILTTSEAKELEAIASRIIPATDTPGAGEAGVIYFMDKALGSFMSDELESIRSGLSRFQSGLGTSFHDMSEADQNDYLRTRDHTHFFKRVHFMTIAGFFGMSAHGGNRDNIGWKLIGFEGQRGAWAPPFGHYDAEYMRGERDGE